MRQTGFTLVEVLVVTAIIGVLASLGFPAYSATRKSANEGSAIKAMRMITQAQSIDLNADTNGNGTLDFASNLAALTAMKLIDERFSDNTKDGYRYEIESVDAGETFRCRATPLSPSTGDRTFFVDETGVIRFSSTGVADATSAPIG